MINFQALNAHLLASGDITLQSWFPAGKKSGNEFLVGDLSGAPGESLSINLKTGKWKDFAGDAKGGDLVSLYAAMRGLSQIDAAKALGGDQYTNGHDVTPATRVQPEAQAESDEWQRPAHVNISSPLFKHRTYGLPSHFWVYRDSDGPMFVVARYDPADKRKQIVPWIWNGHYWVARAPGKPRPLFGLDRLLAMPDKPVLLVEGEKAAEAAQGLFASRPCVTWMGGVAGVASADWKPLAGRVVDLWPDADEVGIGAMAKIAGTLLHMGCKVRVVMPSGMPDGWDLADALAEGKTAAEMVAFARAHIKPVEPPKLAPAPTPLMERVQAVAAPGRNVLTGPEPSGSVFAEYEQLGLSRKGNGVPYCNQANVMACLAAHPDLDLHFDEFSQRIMVGTEEYDDGLNLRMTHYLQTRMQLHTLNSRITGEAALCLAMSRRVNPVRDWLSSLQWDGTARLADMLSVGMGAKASEYTAAVSRCFMIGMVARAMKPGCKVDAMPVFEGAQGVGKSTALKIIGGPYFAEIHESITSKDFYIAITGKLLCEISELHAFRRAEIERIKGIITTATDRYRSPYGRTAQDHPRSCVFAGTTNVDDWNSDETGARRFWPIRCGEIYRGWLELNRTQLFAEAVHRYRAGEDWWDVPEAEARIQREARRDIDPWEHQIASYLDAHDTVQIPHILTELLKVDPAKQDVYMQKRVGKILRARGFHNRFERVGQFGKRSWVRKEGERE